MRILVQHVLLLIFCIENKNFSDEKKKINSDEIDKPQEELVSLEEQ